MPTKALTIGDLLRYFRPEAPDALPAWPPDALALAVTLLRDGDAYTRVVESWPPGSKNDDDARRWEGRMRSIAAAWRAVAGGSRQPQPPPEVVRWWRTVVGATRLPLHTLRGARPVVEALLQLVATADEASTNAGSWTRIADSEEGPDPFGGQALNALYAKQTLARTLDRSRIIVFPKTHTPQRGITARSLTHHLAVYEPRDVVPRWFGFPHWLEAESKPEAPPRNSLNLLLLPWPEAVVPHDYRVTDGQLLNMPGAGAGPRSAYGFFTYGPRTAPVALTKVRRVLPEAKRSCGRVDAIVFPELALEQGQAKEISRALDVIVIGGEGRSAAGRKAGSNDAVVAMPISRYFGVRQRLAVSFRQGKHHRWCLDAPQVQAYGLGGKLDPGCDWWEHIALPQRRLHFFELAEWLTFCVLICEDLARQDPVSELVRAVGPNLVVALLMDGPQLKDRWAAKYATVLAEDPGSSVLTFTSVGMARLCRPHGRAESRVVALWKDPLSAAVEIIMPENAKGLLLSLTRERTRERTADGREDGWGSDYLRLHGVHPVRG